jgi:RNA polymerase sigma-70 factor (ECF subfamily)
VAIVVARESGASEGRLFVGHRPMAAALTDETEPSDDALLRSVERGDREAFVLLYRRYQDIVHRFAFQMSGSTTTAEDITQETFLALTRGAPRYNASQAKFTTYLYGMVRHLTRSRLRRDRIFATLTGADPDRWRAREPLVEQSLVEAASKQQTIDRVRRAVLSLPPRYREVVVLCDLHSRGYEEAAAIVGCSVGTVRSRLHRSRDLLRRKLAPATGIASARKDVHG